MVSQVFNFLTGVLMNELDKLRQLRQEIDRKIARAIYEQKRAWDRNAEKRLSMVGTWYLRTKGIPLDVDLEDLDPSFEASLTDKQKILWERPVDVKKRRGWSWEKGLIKQSEESSDSEDVAEEATSDEAEANESDSGSSMEYETQDEPQELVVSDIVELQAPFRNEYSVSPSPAMAEVPSLETIPSANASNHTIIVGTPVQTATTNTRLHAGVHDRDAVKALGARWDDQSKCWYVPIGMDLSPFARWL